MRVGHVVAPIVLGTILFAACRPAGRAASDSSASARRAIDTKSVAEQPVDTSSLAEQERDTTTLVIADSLSPAYQQFAKFLSLAVATRVPHVGMDDSVYSRGTDLGVAEQYADMRWVAASRILSVSTKDDVGHAAAVITEVARQVEVRDGYKASYSIRDDTAHWRLARGVDSTGRWLVVGDAMEGFGVSHIGRDVRWVSGSRAQALAAVDSIRRARGLPIVR